MQARNQQPMPVVFVSHGAPTLAIEDGAAHRFLRGYGARLGRPTAILVLSAHFEATVATITAGPSPATIHDFHGFPCVLYDLAYPAPGDPGLADAIVRRLLSADIPARLNPERGLDHGVWIPLLLMYPEADIPVLQLSLDPPRGPRYHYDLGRQLAPLRDEGVLIIGSGGVTHNLRELAWDAPGADVPSWAASFNEWVAEAITEGRDDDLVVYREQAPYAARNHPTEEHFFPLLCALGAAHGELNRTRVHHSYTMGALSMDVFQFGRA